MGFLCWVGLFVVMVVGFSPPLFLILICILCVPFYIFLQAILYMFFKRETFSLENGALEKGQLFAWREERGRWAGGLGCG